MSVLNQLGDIFSRTPFSAPAPAPATRIPAASLDTFLRLVYEQYRRKGAANIFLDELLRFLFVFHIETHRSTHAAPLIFSRPFFFSIQTSTERLCFLEFCTRF